MTGDELKRQREAKGLTQDQLAAEIGKKRLTISRWENDYPIPVAAQKALKMFFDNASKNSKYTQNDSNKVGKMIQEAAPVEFNTSLRVPVVSHRAQAGFLSGWGDPEYIEELPTMTFDVDKEYQGHYVCFEVAGDSMYDDGNIDSLFEHDILLCREVQQHHWTNKLHIHAWKYFVIAHRTKGILVKQITDHNTDTGRLLLHSFSPYFDDQEVFMDDLIAIFNVVDIKRSGRR